MTTTIITTFPYPPILPIASSYFSLPFPGTSFQAGPSNDVLCTVCDGLFHPCRGPQSRRPLSAGRLNQDAQGLVAFLPSKNRVSPDSLVHDQVNDGAFSHPLVIGEISQCGHMAYCLPVTSFSQGGGIQRKYARASPQKRAQIFDRYMAIEHPELTRHNSQAPLKLAEGYLDKPSYVNLSEAYWIEGSCLEQFCAGDVRIASQDLKRLLEQHETHEKGSGSCGVTLPSSDAFSCQQPLWQPVAFNLPVAGY